MVTILKQLLMWECTKPVEQNMLKITITRSSGETYDVYIFSNALVHTVRLSGTIK